MSDDNSLKIDLKIAGRTYPARAKNEQEVAKLQSASEVIQKMMLDFEKNYRVQDKQDIMAMCLVQILTQNSNIGDVSKEEKKEIINKLQELHKIIDTVD